MIKTMNNKMAKNTNLSTIESKKQTNQTRDRIMDTENVLMIARWEGVWGKMGEVVRGLRSTNR